MIDPRVEPRIDQRIDESAATISVLDFRRRRMSVRWNIAMGSWVAHEEAPKLVNGVALIRSTPPHICLFGQSGRLILQIAREQYELLEDNLRVTCEREWPSLGFRRRFTLESNSHEVFYLHRYWANSGPDFFKMLADKARDGQWRAQSAARWSAGIDSTELRSSWAE